MITSLYHFTFDQPLLTNVHWIQCHEPTFSTFRVTLYPNFQSNHTSTCHLTVEVLSENEPNLEAIGRKVYKELIAMRTISPTTKILYQKNETIKGGFPIPTHQFVSNSRLKYNFIKKNLKNVSLLGKASGNSFFMNEVLVETFKTLTSLKIKI